MKNRAGNVAGQLGQFLVALVLHAGFVFLGHECLHRALRHDAPRHAQRVSGDFAVGVGAQVVGRYRRRIAKVRRADVDRAPAGRVQVANAGCHGIEGVQRRAEGVQAKRLHVVLDIGVGLLRVAACERT